MCHVPIKTVDVLWTKTEAFISFKPPRSRYSHVDYSLLVNPIKTQINKLGFKSLENEVCGCFRWWSPKASQDSMAGFIVMHG